MVEIGTPFTRTAKKVVLRTSVEEVREKTRRAMDVSDVKL